MNKKEETAIRETIVRAYIQGIHGSQDPALIKSGFDSTFTMLVKQDDAVDKVTMEQWLTRIEKMKADNPQLWQSNTTYTFKLVDITGNVAVAKLEVYKGTTFFSTDYMFLYKFSEGWRIVSKVFAIPQSV